jgi:hypothetical protein
VPVNASLTQARLNDSANALLRLTCTLAPPPANQTPPVTHRAEPAAPGRPTYRLCGSYTIRWRAGEGLVSFPSSGPRVECGSGRHG